MINNDRSTLRTSVSFKQTSCRSDCCYALTAQEKMGLTVSSSPVQANTDLGLCCKEELGIKCFPDFRINEIDWSNKSLNGGIPEEFKDLTVLSRLNLSSNQITYGFPDFLASDNMKSL